MIIFTPVVSLFTAPGDYTAIPLTGAIPVNFQPGQLSTTVTVPIRNDEAIEPDENFFGRLRSTGVGDVSITQDRAEVIIVNDDGIHNIYT